MSESQYTPGKVRVKFINSVPVDSSRAEQVVRKLGATLIDNILKDRNIMDVTVPFVDDENFIKEANSRSCPEIEWAKGMLIKWPQK